jgi:hypothetical protein
MEKKYIKKGFWRVKMFTLVGETPLICHKWNPNKWTGCLRPDGSIRPCGSMLSRNKKN